MSKKYGFTTGQLTIEPYLTRQEILEDIQSGLLEHFRRPGNRTYHIIFRDHVEPYYRAKGIPESVIAQKLKRLKLNNRIEIA